MLLLKSAPSASSPRDSSPRPKTRHSCLPPNLPPRGLSRQESATYIGIGTTKFDEKVINRTMPAPRMIDGRKVWDLWELDAAFSKLPHSLCAAPQLAPLLTTQSKA